MSSAAFVLALDVLGTLVFAVNGAFTASRAARLDIVGVIVLGVTTAVGGGILRDVLIGATPPNAFVHWYYLAVATGGSLVAFYITRMPRLLEWPMVTLDAVGLSLFCVSGAKIAAEAGLSPVPAAILGAITGVGGGTIRDIIVRQVPTVLTSELYAIPALLGATVVVVGMVMDAPTVPVAITGFVVCFGLRMAGVAFDLEAPRPRSGDPGTPDAATPQPRPES